MKLEFFDIFFKILKNLITWKSVCWVELFRGEGRTGGRFLQFYGSAVQETKIDVVSWILTPIIRIQGSAELLFRPHGYNIGTNIYRVFCIIYTDSHQNIWK
jgi:hypothetical protein